MAMLQQQQQQQQQTQILLTLLQNACVMLLWVYIHTGQAWKICLATMGFEPRGQAYFSSLPGVDIYSE
jgi:hypothetical protein